MKSCSRGLCWHMDSILQDIPMFCVCQKKGLRDFVAQFRSKRRRTAENVSHQVWPQVSAWLHTKTQGSHQFPPLCHVRRSSWRKREAVGLHLLKAAQKRTLRCERLVYTRLSPDNSPQLYELWGGGGFTKASNELTKPWCRLCFEALTSVLLNRCQKHPPGPSNSRAWLPTHHLSLCSAFPGWSHADSCLSLGAAGGLPPASLQWGALPGGRQHNQQLRAKLHRQEVKPGLLSSLVWFWHPPLGPSWLQKRWETLTQFADDLCSAVYFKHKQLSVIKKQDLNTLET